MHWATNILKIIALPVLLMLVFSPYVQIFSVPVAHAAGTRCEFNGENTVCTSDPSVPDGKTVTTNAAGKETTSNADVSNNSLGCGISSVGIAICLTNIIYVVTVGIGSGFAYVAAIFFDFAVALSLNSAAYALNFISTGWTTVRDVANMSFIFILIYMAIIIILEAETHDTIKTLVLVLFIALVVNFSFFITRVGIDAGNLLAVQFYNAIPAPTMAESFGAGINANNAAAQTVVGAANTFGANYTGDNTKDLTASIMNVVQLQNLFNTASFQKFAGNQSGITGFSVTFIALAFLYIAAAIMLWLLTITFVVNGVKFLIRIVALWFLIIVSPLAFVARGVGPYHKYFNEWRDLVLRYSAYPAVFLFGFLILTQFMTQLAGSCGAVGAATQGCFVDSLFGSITNANSSTFMQAIGITIANIGIRMGFVIAVLYIAMKAADEFGLRFAESAGKVGEWVGNKGLLKAYNVGYKRIGPGAIAGGLDERLKKTKFGNSLLGYELRRYVTKPIANSRIPGSGGESHTEMVDRQKKETVEKQAGLQDVDNTKTLEQLVAITAALKPLERLEGTVDKLEEKEYKALRGRGPALTAAEATQLADARTTLATRGAQNTLTEGKELKSKIKKMGKRELESIKASDLETIASVLSEEQVKSIKSSEKLTEQNKRAIETTWHTEAGGSPLKKSNREVGSLRDLRDELEAFDPHYFDGTTIQTKLSNAGGETMDGRFVKRMQDDSRDLLARAQQDTRNAATPALKLQAERRVLAIKEMTGRFTKLGDAVKDIPANMGGEPDEGKFRTSAV